MKSNNIKFILQLIEILILMILLWTCIFVIAIIISPYLLLLGIIVLIFGWLLTYGALNKKFH